LAIARPIDAADAYADKCGSIQLARAVPGALARALLVSEPVALTATECVALAGTKHASDNGDTVADALASAEHLAEPGALRWSIAAAHLGTFRVRRL
jgi:hypothetical protein